MTEIDGREGAATEVRVRDAQVADAEAACLVMRRSIRELCAADHGGDELAMERWCANKTPEQFALWLARPDYCVRVVERRGVIVSVGLLIVPGHIALNYVSPDARFQGLSKIMLAALEACARRHGATVLTLEPTRTAHAFYVAAGYREADPPDGKLWKPADAAEGGPAGLRT